LKSVIELTQEACAHAYLDSNESNECQEISTQ
jgi:hypothetical protein